MPEHGPFPGSAGFHPLCPSPPARVLAWLLALLLATLTLASAQAQAPPATPDAVTLTRADGTVTADWPAVSGATRYHVAYSTDGGASWHAPVDDSANVPTNRLTFSADNGKTYVVGVRAGNDDGWGDWTNSAPAGPYQQQPPAAVGSVNVTRTDGTVSANWNASDGAERYHVTYTTDNGASWSLAALEHQETSIAINNADNGKTYVVGVRAGNDDGWSGWRNSAAAGPYVPPAPPAITAIRGDGGDSATVSWTPYGGSDFQSYRVIVCDDSQYDGSSCSGTVFQSDAIYDVKATGPMTVTGLDVGTGYGVILQVWRDGGTLKVHATLPALVTPPSAPSGLSATVGDESITLTWDDPSDGSITGYEYNVNHNDTSTGNFSGWGPWQSIAGSGTDTVSHVIDGLTNGKEYRYRLRAVNAGGAGGVAPTAYPWYVSATPHEVPPTLVVENVTATSFTLRVSNLSGPWSYQVQEQADPESEAGGAQAQSGNVVNCVGPIQGVAGNVEDLTPGTTYDLTAYRDGSCQSAFAAQGTSTLHVSLVITDTGSKPGQAHTISIRNWSGSWWLEETSDNTISCTEVTGSQYPHTVSTPGAGFVYRQYLAYSKAGCNDRDGARDLIASGYFKRVPPIYLTKHNVSADYAELRINGFNGNWSLRRDVPAGNHKCLVGMPPDHSAKLRNLSPSTEYTYTAYRYFSCEAKWPHAPYPLRLWGTKLASITFSTLGLSVSSITPNSATLNLRGYAGNWWLKRVAPADTACQSKGKATTENLSNLTADKLYGYIAYRDSGCTNVLDTVYFSTTDLGVGNLTETAASTGCPVGRRSGVTIKCAAAFITGGSQTGYALSGVTASFGDKVGSPGDLVVAIHAADTTNGSNPAAAAKVTLSGSDPDTAGLYTYTCAGINCHLAANTTYFVVTSTADTSGQNLYYALQATTAHDEAKQPADNGWSIANVGRGWTGDDSTWKALGNLGFGSPRTVMLHVAANDRIALSAAFAGTEATLTLANHAGTWYYRADKAPHASCSTAVSTRSVTLSGLAPLTSYTYTAYSDAGCTTALATAATFTTPLSPKQRYAAKDFDTLNAAGNNDVAGLWSNGTTMWVVDYADAKIYAYNMSDGSRDAAKDFNTLSAAGNGNPHGLWSNGTTMWVSDYTDDKLYAYKMSDKSRDATKDFDTLSAAGNDGPQGLWSDGTTMWVVDYTDGKIYAYKMSDKSRDAAKDFNTFSAAGNGGPTYIWSDGATMWVADYTDGKIYAYKMLDKSRDAAKDFDTLSAAGNGAPHGLWSNGATMWVADLTDDKIYAYQMPARLTASSVTTTTATLTLANHTGNWYYQADSGPDSTCQGPVSGASQALTGLTGGTTYTYTAYSKSGCSSADEIVTMTFITHGLGADSLTPTGATLTLTGHTGNWWLKQTSPSTGTCTAGEADFSHALDTLTAGTSYTYTAYRDSTCATLIDTVTFTPVHSPGERYVAKDFNTLSAAGNHSPRGLWSDGTTMWVVDRDDKKLYAYKRSDMSRDAAKDFNTLDAAGNDNPSGVWSDGTTMWVADRDDDKLYAYKMSDRSRDAAKDFDTLAAAGNTTPVGLWSDGTTMWVADYNQITIYAYKMADRTRDAAKDFGANLQAASNAQPFGIWSDGTTMWVADRDDAKLYAYKMSDKSRDAAKDVNDAGNRWPYGLWSDGATMWVSDYTDGKIYAYQMPPRLTASSVTGTTATLTLSNHTGNWYYQADSGPDSTCQGPVSGASKALTGLTGSTTYTYTAYSKSGCNSADEIETVTFPTHGLAAGSLTPTGATLTLTGHTGNWWLKQTSPSAGTCTAGEADFSHALDTLTGGTSYTYTAYRDSTCATLIYTVTFTPVHSPGERYAAKDFDTLQAAGNRSSTGLWSDGTTMWVADRDAKLYAYKMSDKSRDAAKDFNTLKAAGNDHTGSLWSDGTTMWVADRDAKLYAYKMSDKSRDAAKDFDTLAAAGNHRPSGLWSDGTTMWVGDYSADKLYAYKMSDKSRDAAKDFNTLAAAGNSNPWDLWSDGVTMWVADYDDGKLYAYKTSDKSRDAGKDFDTLQAAGNTGPVGLWSDGTTMWVSDWFDDKLYAYQMPSRLTASSITGTTATLTLSNHTGNWYYRANRAPHTTCSSAQTTASASLSTLTAGTSYTYTAYSKSGCNSTDALTSVTFSTPSAGSGSLSNTAESAATPATGPYTAGTAGGAAQPQGRGQAFRGGDGINTPAAVPGRSAGNAADASAAPPTGYVSNLASTRSGDSDVDATQRQAVAFTTGPNPGGYVLKSFTAALRKLGGDGDLVLTLHETAEGGQPSAAVLATLVGSAPASGAYTDVTYTCSGSGCRLGPDTTYFVVAEAVGVGAYAWAYVAAAHLYTETTEPADSGWTLGAGHVSEDNGDWTSWDDWHHARIDFEAPKSPAVTVGNLDRPVHDDACFPSGDVACAVGFTTGPHPDGYTLDAVTARFAAADDPDGLLGDIAVTLHADGGGVPGALLATLSGDNPRAAGDYAYVCFGLESCVLSPNTTYFVQITAAAGEYLSEAYEWAATLSDHETQSPAGNGWRLADGTDGYESAWVEYRDVGLLRVFAVINPPMAKADRSR